MKKVISAVKAFVTKAGSTPTGKGIEHAVVAAVSLALAALIAAPITATSLKAAVIFAGTTAFAGIRAVLKAKAQSTVATLES